MFALPCGALTFVRKLFSFVGEALPFSRDQISLISDSIALISNTLSLGQFGLAPGARVIPVVQFGRRMSGLLAQPATFGLLIHGDIPDFC